MPVLENIMSNGVVRVVLQNFFLLTDQSPDIEVVNTEKLNESAKHHMSCAAGRNLPL